MDSMHPNLMPILDDDPADLRLEREQARTAECDCPLPVYGMLTGFFKIGVRSTCKHCASTIETGVLYGGYEEETDRFYWKELTFHHYSDECGLPGPFPGRTSRQWMAAIDEPIFKTPGGIGHQVYQQLLKSCGAAADYMLHSWRLGFSGQLVRCKPSTSTLLRKAQVAGITLYGESQRSVFNRFPGVNPPLRQEPDFQFDNSDVATSWLKMQLDLVDDITPRMMTQLLMDARAVLGRYPAVRCTMNSQAHRTETRVALLWQIWRSRRKATERCDVDRWVPVVDDVAEVMDHIIDSATERAGEETDAAREELLRGYATERPAEERTLLVWASNAEVVLRASGLGIEGVDGTRVFFHKPSKPMGVERQKQALIQAGVYHALEICWERSCYATEQAGFSSSDCWWVPREWFKRVSPLAASIADEDAIPIPGYRPVHEFQGRDWERDCGCWDWVRGNSEQAPWKGFFVTTADIETYNRSGFANADPQAHRWCSAKLLFDYTPYVTRSDWLHCLADQRWMWENHERRCLQARAGTSRQRAGSTFSHRSRSTMYANNSEIWKHFKPEEFYV
jgi:hypothetical protein